MSHEGAGDIPYLAGGTGQVRSRFERAPMSGPPLSAGALCLAAEGLAVFPCRIDKRPATPQGFKDAVRHPDAVRELFGRFPGQLVGIATGTPSKLAVLDIDKD